MTAKNKQQPNPFLNDKWVCSYEKTEAFRDDFPYRQYSFESDEFGCLPFSAIVEWDEFPEKWDHNYKTYQLANLVRMAPEMYTFLRYLRAELSPATRSVVDSIIAKIEGEDTYDR